MTLIWAKIEANNTSFGPFSWLLPDDKAIMNTFINAIRRGICELDRPITGASGAAPFGELVKVVIIV